MTMTMTRNLTLQDRFLTALRREKTPVTFFLMNGFQMRGTVTAYDGFTVFLQSEGKQQMIYKHAISTISPMKNLNLADSEP